MALSQVALNVFYLFNGRKILCCPQTQTTHSSVTAARGHFQQWGCECIHICPSICSHAPYGIWGSCCMAMSVQRLQCAAGGWASLGFQLPAAPRSFWAVVARRGQSSVPGHSGEVCAQWIQGKWNLDFVRKGLSGHNIAEVIAISFLRLFYSVHLCAAMLLNIYFTLNGSTDVQKAISGESKGTCSALRARQRLPSHRLHWWGWS